MKFNVHAYKIMRVKIEGVEAESPELAAKWVDDNLDCSDILCSCSAGPADVVDHDIVDERALNYLIDYPGDGDYQDSRWLWKDGKTPLVVNQSVTDLLELLAHRLGEKVIDDILEANRDRLPLLIGLDEGLDERLRSIIKEL